MRKIWNRFTSWLLRPFKARTISQKSGPTSAGEWIAMRRRALGESAPPSRVPDEGVLPHGALGLALAGGGIRSATLSLGLVQALTRRDRLFDFDYMSTVSGGGYFGAFLGSLFTPMQNRGASDRDGKILALQGDPKWWMGPAQHRAFVEFILGVDANEDQIQWPGPPVDGPQGGQYAPRTIRNPIWWLREHGRYLAPNGPTDYMYAIATISRNWLAMLYTFTVLAAMLAFVSTMVCWVLLWGATGLSPDPQHWLHFDTGGEAEKSLVQVSAFRSIAFTLTTHQIASTTIDISPLFAFVALFLFLALSSGSGYWVTASLDTNSRWTNRRKLFLSPYIRFWCQFGIVALVSSSAIAIGLGYALSAPLPNSLPYMVVLLGGAVGLAGALIAAMAAIYNRSQRSMRQGDSFTSELRRRMTKLNATAINFLLAALAAAVIDTIALAVLRGLQSQATGGTGASLLTLIVGPAAAFLVSKLPQWLGGGRISKLFGEHIWTVALVVGGLLFAFVAIGADAMVQYVVWYGEKAAWLSRAGPDWTIVRPFGALLLALFVLTGWSSGFINLSSLNGYYTGRLTRAYLGASNLDRLLAAVPANPNDPAAITENHEKDYIDVARYYRRHPSNFGPIHLINATVNETRSRDHSQITDRDRKGVPIVFAPEGILINAARSGRVASSAKFLWQDVVSHDVDSLDLGQLSAISGAAASSGMGARTTLGGALAFTFANVRLGYWWVVNNMVSRHLEIKPSWIALRKGPLATYYYFFSEMTARYSLGDDRVYLSDGGHFENTGAYELLRRGVKVILVCDNGQDQNFEFEDMEDLVRKARIDLGLSLRVADADTVDAKFGRESRSFFLNQFGDDWRTHAKDPATGCALLIEIYRSGTIHPSAKPPGLKPVGYVVWLKPKLFDGLPQDIRGYGARNGDFPQQSTSDQFFDEAQWESYRGVGYVLGHRLLSETFHGADILRSLIPRET